MNGINEKIVQEIAQNPEEAILATLIVMAHTQAATISVLLEKGVITELEAVKMLEPLEKAQDQKPTPFTAQRISRIMMQGVAMEVRDQVRWPDD